MDDNIKLVLLKKNRERELLRLESELEQTKQFNKKILEQLEMYRLDLGEVGP